jgi:very-short-patch-repair endonuclease
MGRQIDRLSARAWALALRQHGVVTRAQLLKLGFTRDAINHRLATGRLHAAIRGVYAVGRPELTREGRWMAAVLACGPKAVLSHGCAADLWEISRERSGGLLEVSVPAHVRRRRPGVVIHRRAMLGDHVTTHRGIPVTTPVATLIDLATFLTRGPLEAVISEADKRDLTNPEALRAAVEAAGRRSGAAALRRVLDHHTFRLTDSELERRFLAIVRKAGLPQPETGCIVDGFKVDFFWPELDLVVETDGLRYHRTPTQQAKDRERDQAHAAAGRTPLRFIHAQVRYEPDRVGETLATVARRLGL